MRRERSGDGEGRACWPGGPGADTPGVACRFRLRGPASPARTLLGNPGHHSREVRIGFCDACLPPRDWLQRLQTVRVFSRVSSPPCAWGTMWSASALLGSRDTS